MIRVTYYLQKKTLFINRLCKYDYENKHKIETDLKRTVWLNQQFYLEYPRNTQ